MTETLNGLDGERKVARQCFILDSKDRSVNGGFTGGEDGWTELDSLEAL